MSKVVIDGTEYVVPEAVANLILMISKERDSLEEEKLIRDTNTTEH